MNFKISEKFRFLTDNIGFVLCVGFALAVGLSTLAPSDIYSSWWWFALWGVVALSLAICLFRGALRRRKPLWLLHLSLVTVLVGGALTRLTSESGTLHLEPEKTYTDYIGSGGEKVALPFSIRLLDFTTEYYPGMSFPRDFRSEVLIDGKERVGISMNKIGKVKDYRLYQSSFDGKGGSVLSLSRDPWGIGVTYAGYLLFVIAGAASLAGRLKPRRINGIGCLLLALFFADTASAAPAVEKSLSDSLARKQIVFYGRSVSFARMSTELTLKLTGGTSVGELDPTRFIASLIVYPEEWRSVPFIKVKSKALRDSLGIDGKYVSVARLYDEKGEYRLQELYSDGNSPLDQEVVRLDEKVALVAGIWQGTAFQRLTSDEGSRDSLMIDAEVTYFRIQPKRLCFITLFILSIVGFICCGLGRFSRFVRWSPAVSFLVTGGVFVWKWAIDGEVPLYTSSDILFFVAVIMSFALIFVSRRHALGSNIGLMAAGCVVLMSWIAGKDPTLTPLLPVLASPWLGAHVSVIMASYALLGLTFPLSVVAVFSERNRKRLNELSGKLLFPGVYLLGTGIILGAMWANVSWGRYWAWDPKETWALVTMMLYAVPLHKSLNVARNPLFFSIYLTLAFLSIVMTYAGVNYLPSLHAYR